jgi:regulator of sirC expression with transglutaminase-like and TPR domain
VNARDTVTEDDVRQIAEIGDADIEIGPCALALAALDRPSTGIARYRDHLDEIAVDIVALAGDALDAASRAAALHEVLAVRHGYAGDQLTYDDVQNANLIRVIDRRKGLPVSLGILFIHAAEAAGWAMAGLAFPYYFLVRIEAAGERLVLDPFEGGASLDAEGMRVILHRLAGDAAELQPSFYEPASKREVLMRLQNNIKTRAIQAGDLGRAAKILRRMVLFAPTYASLWRELSLVEAKRGNLRDAHTAAEDYLARCTTEAQQHDAAHLLQSFKTRLN